MVSGIEASLCGASSRCSLSVSESVRAACPNIRHDRCWGASYSIAIRHYRIQTNSIGRGRALSNTLIGNLSYPRFGCRDRRRIDSSVAILMGRICVPSGAHGPSLTTIATAAPDALAERCFNSMLWGCLRMPRHRVPRAIQCGTSLSIPRLQAPPTLRRAAFWKSEAFDKGWLRGRSDMDRAGHRRSCAGPR